jgi:hypothetical protein
MTNNLEDYRGIAIAYLNYLDLRPMPGCCLAIGAAETQI